MSEETLFTATRRLMRELRICEVRGGFLSQEAMVNMVAVDRELDKQRARDKAAEAAQPEVKADG